MTQSILEILDEVNKELTRAVLKFGPFVSPHEAHSVIREEMEELWDEIKKNKGREQPAFDEAIQLAAMAVRYVFDLKKD